MLICGREAYSEIRAPVNKRDGIKPRIVVKGVCHPNGKPIRFKSVERAERHISNTLRRK